MHLNYGALPGRLLIIPLNLDIIQPQSFILLKSPIIPLCLQPRVGIRCIQTLNIRIGEWIIKDQCEGSFSIFNL